MSYIHNELSHREFVNRENHISHLDYNRENEFFNAVKNGDREAVDRLFLPFENEKLGILSYDALRNIKYHMVITLALIARACIEGGLSMETAYNLSDIYIQRLDMANTKEELNFLHREAINDYVGLMDMLKNNKASHYPKAVTLCVDYIYDNLHHKITLGDLAKKALLSESYLSKLFKKEVGVGIAEYIMDKKIEAAGNMLKYTDSSVLTISDYFCFNSESHFIRTFKAKTGMTPKTYREKYFRVRMD